VLFQTYSVKYNFINIHMQFIYFNGFIGINGTFTNHVFWLLSLLIAILCVCVCVCVCIYIYMISVIRTNIKSLLFYLF